MKIITKEQIEVLKKNIDSMVKSKEQFFFMIFKNPDGSDNITQYSFNMVQEKIKDYWHEAVKTAKVKEDL